MDVMFEKPGRADFDDETAARLGLVQNQDEKGSRSLITRLESDGLNDALDPDFRLYVIIMSGHPRPALRRGSLDGRQKRGDGENDGSRVYFAPQSKPHCNPPERKPPPQSKSGSLDAFRI